MYQPDFSLIQASCRTKIRAERHFGAVEVRVSIGCNRCAGWCLLSSVLLPNEPEPPDEVRSEVAAFAATHGQSLYRAALLLTGAPEPAQDLVQDTYARLLPAWRRVEDKEAARAYAARIMTRLYWRQRRRLWNFEQSLEGWSEAPDQPSLDIDDRIALRTALSRLAPSQRTVIVLRYTLDLSVRDTAKAMHCSEGNVKSQSSRALDRLRELLSDTEPVRRTP